MTTMSRILKGETVNTETKELGNLWICSKCLLIRSSKVTHVHGVPLTSELLEKVGEEDEKKKHEITNGKVDG